MTTYIPDQVIHGFQLLENRFVKEVNAECLHFIHQQSGAQLFKIAADDPNKTFSIIFKTFPESDNGAPHILEHSVLNGSRNFPVKSPFDVLRKGSLNTFINAMTGKDFTMYPIASMNEKDYFNLMHVYLDAVFYPNIYQDERILKQEGWHLELMNPDDSLEYKGVVYNEMKGAFSSPIRELRYHTLKNLYPGNAYGFDSGGHPDSIVKLTYNEFLDYHRKYYHPSNSRIFLYGDADIERELRFIHENYLKDFSRSSAEIFLGDQPVFDHLKDITRYYSLNEGNETDQQTYLSLAFLAGKSTDIKTGFALNILVEVLFNQESAPVRLALEKEGIGREIMAYMANLHQMMVQVIVQNANPGDKDRFLTLYREVLENACREGVDKEAVAGVLNQIEFHLREGDDAQKGLLYCNQLLPGWLFVDNPFHGLEWEKPLQDLKNEIGEGLLENLTRQYLLDNPHGVALTLIPKPGLEKELNDRVAALLQEMKAGMTDRQLHEITEDTAALIRFQQKEDSPEAVARVPMITLGDIDPKAEWFGVEELDIKGIKVLYHEEFTNHVVYTNLYFDLKSIPSEMVPYASLLASLLGMMDTANYDFAALNKAINLYTGGMHASPSFYLQQYDENRMLPKLVVGGKAMNHQLENFTSLFPEILLTTRFEDKERLKSLIGRIYANMDASMKRDGFMVAQKRVLSYFNPGGNFNENTGGLEYYRFISRLHRDFDRDPAAIIQNLHQVSEMLFSQKNMVIGVTASREDFLKFMEVLTSMTNRFPQKEPNIHIWNFKPQPLNEGIQAPSKIQFVIKGFNFKKLGYTYNGRMKVLNQIISTEWLQKQVRVIGGAYGGFSSVNSSGTILFSSYRDPNLAETLENYDKTPDFLEKFDPDNLAMIRFIIGTIARTDSPLTPSEKGELACRYHFSGVTAEYLQLEREAILSTTAKDIREFSGLIKDILAQNVYCVYGDETRISENRHLFGSLVKIGNGAGE